MKHGASLEVLIGMVYTQEELNPQTGKYKKYFDLITVKRDPEKYPEGFSYKVRYKIDLTGIRIPQGLSFAKWVTGKTPLYKRHCHLKVNYEGLF